MFPKLHRTATLLASLVLLCTPGFVSSGAEDSPDSREAQARRRPKTYLAIFINGYGDDPMPQDPAQFEKLLEAITKEGHFNSVLCKYTPEREALCKKHDVLMVVDLLAEPHVFKNPQECEALLKTLRNNPTVAAYHLWADRFANQGAGRARDIDNVHAWDPTHATYTGTYQSGGMSFLAKSDFISYYDFAWKRGPHKNFPNLLAAWSTAKVTDNRLGRYCTTDAGLPGKGNFNRLLYTQTTSIACGLRAAMWHIGSRIMNMQDFQFNGYGKDLAAVNAWIEPMRTEIARIGLPTAIYSTLWTKDWNDRPVQAPADKPAMPPGLEKNAFPADFWIQPTSGEFVMGVSKYHDTDRDVVFLANHNAYAAQNVTLKLARAAKPRVFDRKTRTYTDAVVKDGSFSFPLEPAGGAIVLFE
ncbi:MAG: hypothetical protein K8R23_14655 [Chthoniobacter sp.]|nr:hypothetical protein [Chthoniobacter sp.]